MLEGNYHACSAQLCRAAKGSQKVNSAGADLHGSRGFVRTPLSLDTPLLEVGQNLVIQVHEVKAAALAARLLVIPSMILINAQREWTLNYMITVHWWVWSINVGVACGTCMEKNPPFPNSRSAPVFHAMLQGKSLVYIALKKYWWNFFMWIYCVHS